MLGVYSSNSIDGAELPNAVCCDEDAWEATNASIAIRNVNGVQFIAGETQMIQQVQIEVSRNAKDMLNTEASDT